jgi:hypothetical protein
MSTEIAKPSPRLTLTAGPKIKLQLDHFDDALCALLRGHLDLVCEASTGLHPSELVAAIARRLLEEWPNLEVVVKDGSPFDN